MSHIIEYISSHPKIALCVMIVHLAGTFVIRDFQLPIIIMQVFQLLAFSATITIGVITAYKFFKSDKKW